MRCDNSRVERTIFSDIIKVYYISCYEDQWMFESDHPIFFAGIPTSHGYAFGGRSIWYPKGFGTQTYVRTISQMMTHQTTQWTSYPDWSCVWQQNCQLLRDTNVDVRGTVNGAAQNGRDTDHGTAWGVFGNNDEWITGNPNFVPVAEVTMTNIGTDTYEFSIDTSTSYYLEGLYVECNAGEPG